MKKYLPHIFIATLLLGWTGVFGVEVANAQTVSIVTTVLETVGNMILSVMSIFIYISGLLLDYSLGWTLHISSLVASIPAIEAGWKVFRDLCTMFFIFILLYTAITTILGGGLGSKENAKKVITTVVIAGLFINFSLFFTKLVIDASNVVSLSFYKALVPAPDSKNPFSPDGRTGLSAIFMQSLYIQTVYDPKALSAVKNDKLAGSGISGGFGASRIFINTIMGSIVMLVASIVFLAGAFFFMVRLVILLLLMVTSPIAFAGEALGGKAASQSKRWRESLIDQCLFMPVYLAVTYVGVKIIASPAFQTAVNPGNSTLAGVTGGDSIAVIFNYCVVIIFLMASLIIAKEFGVLGAATFNGWAEGVLKAVPSWTGRNTVGRAGNWADKKLENTVLGNSRIGRSLREITTGGLASNKFGSSMSFKDQVKLDKEISAKRKQIEDVDMLGKGSGNARIEMQKIMANGGPKNKAEQAIVDAVNKAEISLNKMSPSDIVGLTAPVLTQNAPRLNDGQMKAIMKSDKFSDGEKEKILAARLAPIDMQIAIINDKNKSDIDKENAQKALAEAVRNLSDADIENLGYERIKDPALLAAMPYSRFKVAIDKKSEGYSQSQKNELRKIKLQPLQEALTFQALTPDPTRIEKALQKLTLKGEDMSKLPREILVDRDFAKFITPNALHKMIEDIPDKSVRDTIRTNMETVYGSLANPG
ncbi:hypothetical protein EPO17_02295, partial [Patescibacteria group bacterium]